MHFQERQLGKILVIFLLKRVYSKRDIIRNANFRSVSNIWSAKQMYAIGTCMDSDCPDQTAHPLSLIWAFLFCCRGPCCSKLTTSLVNDSLKFTSSDTQPITLKFFAEKMWVAFALEKLLTFFQQKISEYCILNLLKQLTKWPLTSSLS